jgi:hypothetical protein
MTARSVRTSAALGGLVLCGGLLACSNSGSDDQSSGLRASFTATGTAIPSEVVFLRERAVHGSTVAIDVVGRNITAPLDGFDLAIAFEPSVVEAVTPLSITALGTCGRIRPDNTRLLCLDNVAGGEADRTGTLLFSAHPTGTPVPTSIGGEQVLATISFRGIAVGTSPIFFYDLSNRSPGTASFSDLTSSTDPNAALMVEFVPDAAGQASIEIERGN